MKLFDSLSKNNTTWVFLVFVLCALFLNYDQGAIPAVLAHLKVEFQMSEAQQGLLGSLPYAGIVSASPLFGRLLQKKKSKWIIVTSMYANIMATCFLAGSFNIWNMFISRFLIGVTQTGFAVYVPVWVEQYAPKTKKSIWMGISQVSAVTGTMIGYLSTGFFQGRGVDWRWSIGAQCILLFIFTSFITFLPWRTMNVADSPDRWSEDSELDSQMKRKRNSACNKSDQEEPVPHHRECRSSQLAHARPCEADHAHTVLPCSLQSNPEAIKESDRAPEVTGLSGRTKKCDDQPNQRPTRRSYPSTAQDSDDDYYTEAQSYTSSQQDSATESCTVAKKTLTDTSNKRFDQQPQVSSLEMVSSTAQGRSPSMRSISPQMVMYDSFNESEASSGKEFVRKTILESLIELSRNSIYMWVVLSLCSLFFIVTGIQYWSTRWFEEVIQAQKSAILIGFAATAATAPVLGVLTGGILGDKLGGYQTALGRVRTLWTLSALGFLTLIFGILASVLTSFPALVALIWLILFVGGAILPGATGIMISSVPQSLRPLASGLAITLYNILGYILGTLLPGALMQFMGLHNGIRLIFMWSIFGFLGIVIAATCATRRHKKDLMKSSEAMSGHV